MTISTRTIKAILKKQRKAEEVASSPKTLFDKILDKLQNKS